MTENFGFAIKIIAGKNSIKPAFAPRLSLNKLETARGYGVASPPSPSPSLRSGRSGLRRGKGGVLWTRLMLIRPRLKKKSAGDCPTKKVCLIFWRFWAFTIFAAKKTGTAWLIWIAGLKNCLCASARICPCWLKWKAEFIARNFWAGTGSPALYLKPNTRPAAFWSKSRPITSRGLSG